MFPGAVTRAAASQVKSAKIVRSVYATDREVQRGNRA